MKGSVSGKIKSKECLIRVVGLSFVGLPLVMRFVEAGFHAIGCDINATKIEMLNHGKSYIDHIGSEEIAHICAWGRYKATCNFCVANEADALIICVSTPLGSHPEPDISFVNTAPEALLPCLKKEQLVSLESATCSGKDLGGTSSMVREPRFPHWRGYFSGMFTGAERSRQQGLLH